MPEIVEALFSHSHYPSYVSIMLQGRISKSFIVKRDKAAIERRPIVKKFRTAGGCRVSYFTVVMNEGVRQSSWRRQSKDEPRSEAIMVVTNV